MPVRRQPPTRPDSRSRLRRTMHTPDQQQPHPPRRIRVRSAAIAAAATVALVGITAVAYAGTSGSDRAAALAAAAAPAPPAGFTLTWSDEFNGAANTGVNTGVWK